MPAFSLDSTSSWNPASPQALLHALGEEFVFNRIDSQRVLDKGLDAAHGSEGGSP